MAIRGFNPNVQLSAGQMEMQGQQSLFDALYRAQQMALQNRKVDAYEAKQQADIARQQREQMMNPDYILQQRALGNPISREQEAVLQALDAKRMSKMETDPITGGQRPAYSPLAGGGFVDQRTAQGGQGYQPSSPVIQGIANPQVGQQPMGGMA